MGFKPWKVLSILAKLGRPILDILGVKKGTVAQKAAEVAEVVDQTISPSGGTPPQPKPQT